MAQTTPLVTQGADLEAFYGPEVASSYAKSMDDEMAKVTPDLLQLIEGAPEGSVLDTCFGSGHMLGFLASKQPARALRGVDLSADMLKIAAERVPQAELRVGNMLEVGKDGAAQDVALLLNTFALHHVTPAQAEKAIADWAALLVPSGRMYLAVWEGTGQIDYGDMKMEGLLHSKETVAGWLGKAGLTMLMQRESMEEEMGMNSLYVIAEKK